MNGQPWFLPIPERTILQCEAHLAAFIVALLYLLWLQRFSLLRKYALLMCKISNMLLWPREFRSILYIQSVGLCLMWCKEIKVHHMISWGRVKGRQMVWIYSASERGWGNLPLLYGPWLKWFTGPSHILVQLIIVRHGGYPSLTFRDQHNFPSIIFVDTLIRYSRSWKEIVSRTVLIITLV